MPTSNQSRQWLTGIIVVLLIVVVALSSATWWQKRSRFTLRGTQHRVSQVDGLEYRVHARHTNPKEAADTMATIHRRTVELFRHLRAKYLRRTGPARKNEVTPGRVSAVKQLFARYNPDNLVENSPRDPNGDTSYTVGKGEILALCLRERNPAGSGRPNVYDIHHDDLLLFVMIHELTHISIREIDHPPRFWSAFKFLLQEAVQAGVLESVDYSRFPVTYCGMAVDYNPRYDHGLSALA